MLGFMRMIVAGLIIAKILSALVITGQMLT